MAQKAGKRATKTAALRKQALDLRVGGKTYVQIGDAMGISNVMAWNHVQAALAELKADTTETAEKVRRLEIERLDAMLDSLWVNRESPKHADTILRLMERRAKLLGLDVEPGLDEASGAFTVELKVVGATATATPVPKAGDPACS